MGIEQEKAIFIVGCPRSGTTLLASFLDNHPLLACSVETNYFSRILGFEAFQKKTIDRKDLDFLLELLNEEERIRDFFEIYDLDFKDFQKEARDYLFKNSGAEEISCEEYQRRIFDLLMSMFLKKRGKKLWVEQSPHHIYSRDKILELYPGAKIINILRDGRDTVSSLMKMPWRPDGLINNARLWLKYTKQAIYAERELPASNYMNLKFEDLLSDTRGSLERICEFLEIDFDEAIMNRNLEEQKIFHSWEGEWKQNSIQEINSAKIDSCNTGEDEERGVLNFYLARRLRQLSYKPDEGFKLSYLFRISAEYLGLLLNKAFRLIS